jgi:hypothetical protein
VKHLSVQPNPRNAIINPKSTAVLEIKVRSLGWLCGVSWPSYVSIESVFGTARNAEMAVPTIHGLTIPLALITERVQPSDAARQFARLHSGYDSFL